MLRFFDAFDGPAWTTLLLSTAAVAVSAVALRRTKTPQPHWEFLGVVESQNEADHPVSVDQYSDSIYPLESVWSAHLRQNGPGAAESVTTRVRLPSGEWLAERRLSQDSLGRGAEFGVILSSRDRVVGEYLVLITYRCLPNTQKVRTWGRACRLT